MECHYYYYHQQQIQRTAPYLVQQAILRSTAKFDSIFCSSCHGRPGTSWRTSSLEELFGGHNKTVNRRVIDKAVGRIVARDRKPRITRRGATVLILCRRMYSVSTTD
jgi:hypothetical protein